MSTPLQQLLSKVLFDPFTRSDFGTDPEAFLRDNGWSNLEGPELEEAVAALGDTLPLETAEALDSACSSVDFGPDQGSDVGGILADVASQVDPQLPNTMHTPEAELDFGAGADTDTVDGQSEAMLGATDDFADVDVDVDVDEPSLSDIGRGMGHTDADELDIDVAFDPIDELDAEPIVEDIDDYDVSSVEAPDVDLDYEG